MRNKTTNLLGVFCFAIILIIASARKIHAQNGINCSSSIAITTGAMNTGQQAFANEIWFRFTASSDTMLIFIQVENSSSNAITGLLLMDENCNNTVPLQAGKTDAGGYELLANTITTGNVYKIKATLISNPATVGIEVKDWSTSIPPCSCITPPSACQRVCNGGFEDVSAFPAIKGQINNACPWYFINSSPDLYNTQGGTDVDIPVNHSGFQNTHSGSGYAGLICGGLDQREYIFCQLNTPLKMGYKYRVRYWVSLADNSGKAANISILFRNGVFNQSPFGAVYTATPQVTTSSPVQNKTGWTQVTAVITAGGNYTHMVIGNFNYDSMQTIVNLTPPNPNHQLRDHAYYYIDDVSVELLPDPVTAQTVSQVCVGNPAALTASVPGVLPVSWLWYPPAQVTPNNVPNVLIYPQAIGLNYYWIVADWGNGCVTSDTVSMTVLAPATANAGADDTLCSNTSYTLSATGTGGGYSWAILNGAQLCSNCTTVTVSPTLTTSYVFTATNTQTGCIDRDTVKLTFLNGPVIEAGSNIDVCLGQSATLSASISGTYTQFGWSTNLVNSLCNNCTSINFTPAFGTNYAVFSATNTANGCTVTDTVFINLTQLPGVALIPQLGASANILCANVTYTITGAPTGAQYFWGHSSIPAVSGAVTGFGQYTVNWSTANLTTGNVTCTVVAPDGCSAILSLPVNTTCCTSSGSEIPITLNNASSANLISAVQAVCPTCVSGNTITCPPSTPVHINGTFTVNQSLVLVNFNDLRMGTNATVNILAGNALELRNCTTSLYCPYMWDGIYINGTTATLKTTNNTLLQQARNAVVSVSGGVFAVENSTIRNCVKGIVVQPYSAANHNGLVRNTIFEMPGTFLPALPALPTTTTKTLVGIEIDRVSNITIGDAAQTTYKNTFNGLFKGVYALASGTTIRNAEFTNIVASNQLTMSGTAVHCEGQKGVPYTQFINVGGTSANQPCKFDNIRRGIAVSLAHNVNIAGNSFTNFTTWLAAPAVGISVTNCLGRTVNIANNRISNFNTANRLPNGITVTDVGGSTVSITNNRLLQCSSTASSYGEQVGTGITVQNTSAAAVALTVLNNDTISRFAYGITLTNISNTAQALVKSNRVLFAKPKTNYNTQLHYGIGLINCTQIKADSNRVQRITSGIWQSSDAATLATNLRGVYVTNSSGCIISQNTFTGLGEGVHANSTCPATFFVCNQFNQSYRACMFTGANANNAAYLNDQLNFQSTIYPTGNVFVGSATSDLAGSIRLVTNTLNPIFWYYSGILPTTGALVSNSIQNNVPTSTNNSSPCNLTPFLMAQGSDQRDMLAGAQVSVSEDEQAGEMTQEMAAKDAHLLLLQNPDWLNMNTPQDADYQQFYAETDTSEVGKTNHTELAALVDDTLQAVQLNTVLAGTTDLTLTHKTVFEIYNRSWLLDNMVLSAADTAVLLPIALQHPAQGGEAVYTARVMLGITVDDATGNYSYRFAESETLSVIAADVFPNPVATQVTVKGNFNETDVLTFTLFDLSGRVVTNQQLPAGNSTINVDLSTLQRGAYLYQISVNGVMVQSERLVIAR